MLSHTQQTRTFLNQSFPQDSRTVGAQWHCNTRQHTATHCNPLQQTATHYNTLQYSATHCNTLQHAATHYNTLQHTKTHCNTPTESSANFSGFYDGWSSIKELLTGDPPLVQGPKKKYSLTTQPPGQAGVRVYIYITLTYTYAHALWGGYD